MKAAYTKLSNNLKVAPYFTFMMLVVGDQLLLEVFSNLNASVIL